MNEIKSLLITLVIFLFLFVGFIILNITIQQCQRADIYVYSTFYQMIIYFLISLICGYYFYFKYKRDKLLNFLHAQIVFIVTAFAFVMTFPVTVDRSFSVYMLSSLYNNKVQGNTITKHELSKIVEDYFFSQSLVDKRVHEQLATGSITIDKNDVITMTNKGELIVNLNKIIGNTFNLDIKNYDPLVE